MVRVLHGNSAADKWSSIPFEPLEDNTPVRIEGYADLNSLQWDDRFKRSALRKKTTSSVVLAASYAGSDGLPRIARILVKGKS